MELRDLKVTCILNFVSYCQIILQRVCTNFHSHKQWGLAFIFPQSHERWMSSNFFIFANLISEISDAHVFVWTF